MLEKTIKNLLVQAAGLKRFVGKEFSPRYQTPLRNKIRMWSKGFCSDSYIGYGLNKNPLENYLTDLQMYLKAIKINADYNSVLNNKLVFTYLMKSFVRVPEPYAMIKKGQLIPLHQEDTISNVDALIRACRKYGALIFKPIDDTADARLAAGGGVLKLEFDEPKLYLNKKLINREQLLKHIYAMDHYMVIEFIHQAKYAHDIFPLSTNTIKILTLIDPMTEEPFIGAAFHRFGCNQSIPVDNLAQGGFVAGIEIEDGIMTRAGNPKRDHLAWYDNHPETKAPIKGVCIPRWRKLQHSMIQLAKVFAFIQYVAWDIVLQGEGFTVIEGNANTNIDAFQMHRPLLADPRVRDFYKYHKVI